MRALSLLLIGGLALAGLAGPVSADLIKMNITDFDVGSLYSVPNNTSFSGAATLNNLTQTSVVGLGVNSTAAAFSGNPVSDTMGIFRIETIIDITTGSNVLFSNGGPNEITGIFWGLTDGFLQTTASTATAGGQDQEIRGTGMQVAFFEKFGTHTFPGGNSPGPSGFSVVGGKLTYAGITDGTLIWTTRSTSGFRFDDLTEDFFAHFTATASGSAFGSSGDTLTNMGSVDGWGLGPLNDQLDTNQIMGYQTGDTLGTPTKGTDLSFSFKASPAGAGSWILLSSDPITANNNLIPEPVTMAGLLLGVGCLTRYVRKRR